ncbi:hypothetical protein FHR83_001340 [Actinoplanes campanulatus]|uniref:DUF2630 domain-containing protein n=1 Tax=Actinoplanes campanulatus TaxID=113559 RepID=A0A7W5ACD3_9ACTN|nr:MULTISPECIES: DUF2630 family protein [Actinoplanes]MBB3093691.1 hypothetical protein [Actinoplanes campanulatus]GGN05061.1 hypothetical protein GCM10010109_12130 [Actinoplanes campanulatus]GID35231.1 hypothetical protein Aca09nite_17370 [Actinoplanes campanulatus]GID45977.1 hypothetical protein Aca07nite_32520 [Actinoplanes capillaceus]
MDDKNVLSRISDLVDEEHELRRQLSDGKISSDEEHTRLRELEESLDQCWDLLRRRRAARSAGNDPDAEQAHSVDEVENYVQ